MKDYFICITGEWKRYIHRGSLAAWLIILVLMLYQTNASINDTRLILQKKSIFKQTQQTYFENLPNYEFYRVKGFKILFITPSTGLISKNSTNPSDLTAEVLNSHLKINNNWKSKAVFKLGKSLKLDNFGVIKWLMPLLALWFAFGSFLNREFIKSLSSIWSRVRSYLNIVLSRLLLFIVFFLAVMGAVILFMLARGVTFTPDDWSVTFSFLIGSITYLMVFFGAGAIIGIFGLRKLSYILLFAAWLFLTFGAEWITDILVEPAFPDAIEDYQTELDKYTEIINFDKKAEQKYGKFDRKNIEQGRLVIEDYWKNYFLPIILPKEINLRNKLAAAIEKDRGWSQWFPGAFFTQMSNEVSGRGYNNYLLFYDYTIEKHSQFVRFLIDRTYYNDPKIMVNFIKDDEDIFTGKSSLPPNYWTADLIHLGYFLIFLIAGYFCYVAKFYPKPKNAREFDSIEIELKSGENAIIKNFTYKEDFGQQLVNVFFGKCRDLNFKITLDGKSLLTGKKHDFLYIPKPDHIPEEWKVKHLLQFFKRLFQLDPKDLESLYIKDPDLTPKEWLNKFFRELDTEKQAVLLISLFMLVKKGLYIGNNFSDYVPNRVCTALYDLLIEKQPAGSMIIDINRMDNQWIPSNKKFQWFYYTKAKGYQLFKPK